MTFQQENNDLKIRVKEKNNSYYAAFLNVVPQTLCQYKSLTVYAAYYEEGEETDKPLKWSFDDADKGSYVVRISEDSKNVTIQCLKSSKNPLKIIACYGESKVSASIELESY